MVICAGDGRSRRCGGRCRGRGPSGNTQTRALSIAVLRHLWYLFTLLVFLSVFCLPMQHFHFPGACLYASVRRNSPFQTWCKSGGDKRNERWSCWDGSLLEIANHCGISESVWICFDMLLCYIVLDISCMFSSGCLIFLFLLNVYNSMGAQQNVHRRIIQDYRQRRWFQNGWAMDHKTHCFREQLRERSQYRCITYRN